MHAVISITLPGAIVRFIWMFRDSRGGATLTQVVELDGASAAQYVEAIQGMERAYRAGMEKLAAAIDRSTAATEANATL